MKQLEPGATFGNYHVVRKLGEGGMGEVWLLRSQTDATPVAAKILNPEDSADHEARRRFVREAELAMNVRSENLVTVYDVGEDPDSELCYILMEYVPGGTLADYLRRKGALAVEDAVAVVHAIAQVLDLAQAKGIVHRDIKPANIMFAADGTPKLADLGIARTRGAGGNTTTVTQTGMMIGTPAYMAPEQMLDSHSVDVRADIYSLGIVFFEMVAGVRPNADASVVQLMAKAVAGEAIPDVREFNPETPAAIAEMIDCMCAGDVESRIASPRRIVEWCEKILSGERPVLTLRRKTGPLAPPPPPESPRRAALRRSNTFTTLLTGFIIVAVAFGFGFVSSKLMNAPATRPSRESARHRPAAVRKPEPVKPPEVVLEPASLEEIEDELELDAEAAVTQRVEAARLMDYSTTLSVQKTLNELFPGWKTTDNMERLPDDVTRHEGYVDEHLGRRDCVCTHPVSREQPQVTLSREVTLPDEDPVLRFSVTAHSPDTEFRVTARVNGTIVWEGDVAGGKWEDVTVDLSNWSGLDAQIELIHRATGWYKEWAYWSRLEVGEWDGEETRVFRPHVVEPLHDYHLLRSEDPTVAVQNAARLLFPGWEVSENGKFEALGYHEEFFHRRNVLLTHPPREGVPVTFTRSLVLPRSSPTLVLEAASSRQGDFEVEVLVDGQLVRREGVAAKDGYKHIAVPLGEWAGYSVKLEVRHQPTGWMNEHAYWSKIEVVSGGDLQKNGGGDGNSQQ